MEPPLYLDGGMPLFRLKVDRLLQLIVSKSDLTSDWATDFTYPPGDSAGVREIARQDLKIQSCSNKPAPKPHEFQCLRLMSVRL